VWQGCARAVGRASSRRRLSVLLIGYLLLTLVMGWRLVGIQVIRAEEYRSLADRQAQREITLAPRRGKLYDRAGEPLAMSLAAATIYANPRQLAASGVPVQTVADRLAPVLDRPRAELIETLRRDAAFVYLARQLPRKVGTRVDALKLPGVGVLEESRRVYPSGKLAAQVVGFAGIDGDGLAGMEAALEPTLAGQAGTMHLEQAPRGLEISTAPRQLRPPVPGDDVVLTIDREIQAVTEGALRSAVRRYNAKAGSAVVLDVKTGQVLAMASMPDFDPEALATSDPESRKNRAVTDVYEPGSVNKVITASAALEEGLATVDEKFKVPALGYRVGPKVFTDSHPPSKPRLTFREIMEQSSNVGTIRIAERLGPQGLHRYLRKFGYGSIPGTGFPGESAGLLAEPKDWSATSLPTIAIGQGVSASLLQVANVFNTIATGGEFVQPTLVRGTVGEDGRLTRAPAPERRRVVSKTTARTMADMLVGVVEDDYGTCELCAVPGYRVGGKTGTAQKPSETHRGYQAGAYIGSFVGFAPVEDPAVVVGVMIDEPRPVYYGGLTAGPTFAEIMEFTLNHRRVPPSNPAARAVGKPAEGPPAPPAPTATSALPDDTVGRPVAVVPDWARAPATP
ncbi:MAG TPA: penicillin-binding protein 2, partial [Egibacteraceae bacterium]|nr:penicillin-binding protein 2 [Egibacteraceae bacterium]